MSATYHTQTEVRKFEDLLASKGLNLDGTALVGRVENLEDDMGVVTNDHAATAGRVLQLETTVTEHGGRIGTLEATVNAAAPGLVGEEDVNTGTTVIGSVVSLQSTRTVTGLGGLLQAYADNGGMQFRAVRGSGQLETVPMFFTDSTGVYSLQRLAQGKVSSKQQDVLFSGNGVLYGLDNSTGVSGVTFVSNAVGELSILRSEPGVIYSMYPREIGHTIRRNQNDKFELRDAAGNLSSAGAWVEFTKFG